VDYALWQGEEVNTNSSRIHSFHGRKALHHNERA
jgi:hypothetical protein